MPRIVAIPVNADDDNLHRSCRPLLEKPGKSDRTEGFEYRKKMTINYLFFLHKMAEREEFEHSMFSYLSMCYIAIMSN